MNLNHQKTKYRALDDWFNTPQGAYVGDLFASRLALIPEIQRGSILLQLGSCGANHWLDEFAFRRQWIASPCLDASNASMIAAINALPLDRNTVDCVLAPLALEAFGWDKNPLDEIDRVLKPMGNVVFLGINPFSLWGLAARLGALDCLGTQPCALISPLLLQQSLLRRGYRQCSFESFHTIPPVRSKEWMQRLAFLNEVGKMMTILPAGFYCLVMQKYQHCPPNRVRSAYARRAPSLTQQPAWASRSALRIINPKTVCHRLDTQ